MLFDINLPIGVQLARLFLSEAIPPPVETQTLIQDNQRLPLNSSFTMSALNGGSMKLLRNQNNLLIRLGIVAVLIGAVCILVPTLLRVKRSPKRYPPAIQPTFG